MKYRLILVVCLVFALTLPPQPGAVTQAAPHNTYTVNTTSDEHDGSCSDGDCSLRDAIIIANTNPSVDTIEFDIPPASCMGGICTIYPLSVLPGLTNGGTTIDGYTQAGAEPATATAPADIRVQIDGRNVLNGNGLEITSANNVIRGLAIVYYDWNGIAIGNAAATGNVIAGNYLGAAPGGVAAPGNGFSGVFIGLAATNNTVGGDTPAERNLLSGNGWVGAEIHGSSTMSNTISGNYIGTTADGLGALPNLHFGVRVYGGAQNNIIGGDSVGERNLISGNADSGVRIVGAGTNGNVVSGNYIGVDITGGAALANNGSGVYIALGAQNNLIGGNDTSEHNVISGNAHVGVEILDANTTGNTISGNFIGTIANGLSELGNQEYGVAIQLGAQNNLIGGDSEGERNVISGNDWDGVMIASDGTTGNIISGNYIGLNANGLSLGNGDAGVWIVNGASGNLVGGDTPAERNVISKNEQGVYIEESGSNTVSGNYIGLDPTGTTDMGNLYQGVLLTSSAHDNLIGGDIAGGRNVISGNDQVGVQLEGADTTHNVVSGNYIGTSASGTAGISSAGAPQIHGVVIQQGACDNTIGGDTPGERNVISANGNYAVGIWDAGTDYNIITGNYIGTDTSGAVEVNAGQFGVIVLNSAQHNWVLGGIIAHHSMDGVHINGATTTGNFVSEVSIFDNALGINLENDANGNIPAPGFVSIGLEAGSVVIRGKSCMNCIIEVFANRTNDGEGQIFLGHTVADALGHWTFSISTLPYPYLTATARDAIKGTSEFSGVFTSTVRSVFLPLIAR
jgi:titin